MPEIIHFIDPTKASKITSLAFGPNGNNVSITSNTDELITTSGINPIYDDRFKARTVEADSLNTHPGYFYLDRANHSGSIASSSDAATLNNKSGHYYLDMNNFSGNINNRSVYMSGINYSVSSGTSNDIGFKSGAHTVNWTISNLQTINLSGNTTLVFSGAQNGSRLQLMINQDSVGSRTIAWPASTIVKWPGGTAPTLTTTASGVDMIAFYVDNGKYYGTSALDFR